MQFKVKLGWTIRDKDGNIIEETEQEANSFVRAIIDWIYAQMGGVNLPNTPDTSNTNRTDGIVNNVWQCNAPATNTNWGVLVGTGITAVTIADYNIETLIAHGNGAGQLMYGATSVGAPNTVGATRQFTIARTFTNNSGGLITVTEVALVSDYTASTHYFCNDRTLSTRAIADGASGTATYTIYVTV